MSISRYCATDFHPKQIGYIYGLRHPYDGTIFYVGKTTDLKIRLLAHISDSRKEKTRKEKLIASILKSGKRPIINVIEKIEIRTKYDYLLYDYREFYWIRNYLMYGWDLLNLRVTDTLSSEYILEKILFSAKNEGKLSPGDFYYTDDEKGFPIYDLKKIKSLGYGFSKSQFASHWAYIIDVEKYSNVRETTRHYIYSDIPCEQNYNHNWSNY